MSFSLPHEQINFKEEPEVPLHTTIGREAKLLVVDLALPSIVIQLGTAFPAFSTASVIGTSFGYLALDGYTLANLTGNLCTLALTQGFFSACDTLQPQAFATSHFVEVGYVAIRGLVASMLVVAVVNIFLCVFLRDILVAMGQDPEASSDAYHFYVIYMLALPSNAMFNLLWKFSSSQNILAPVVGAVVVSCLLVLPVALKVFTHLFGYLGAAVALVTFQISEVFVLLSYLAWKKPYHPETWPGLGAWRQAFEWKPVRNFLSLAVGGMLASLEWVYWEALSLVVGLLGVVELSVHTVPTQVIMVAFMPPLGVGIALAVRLGATLPYNVPRAKALAAGTLVGGVTCIFLALTLPMYVYRELIFDFFIHDDKVKNGCEEIWGLVCVYYFLLSLFGINIGIATALHMQWTLGIITVIFLWFMGLPTSYYFAIVRNQGLYAYVAYVVERILRLLLELLRLTSFVHRAWWWIVPPYVFINAGIMFAFCRKNWDAVAENIRLRKSLAEADDEAESLRLNEAIDHHYGSLDAREIKDRYQERIRNTEM